MTKEQIEQNAEAYRAWLEGKEVQYYSASQGWAELRNFNSIYANTSIRIKPAPKLRPWRAEEVPVGALIRNESNWIGAILARSDKQILTTQGSDLEWESFESALACYTHSIDHGKTWHPCGVIES